MSEPGRKPPESASRADAELVALFSVLTVEQQRHFLREMHLAAEASDNVVPFEEILLNREFRVEASALAAQAGIELTEFALAVNPLRYPAYSAPSKRCRLDRYLARTGAVDIRVQVYTRIEFTHRLLTGPFTVLVLEGSLDVERAGVFFRLDPNISAAIGGDEPVTLRASAQTRFVYVDHPLTAWIRANLIRRDIRDAKGRHNG